MKSVPDAGQFDLRGKKTKHLRCGCCVIQDHRQYILDKTHRYEMRNPDEFTLTEADFDCVEDFLRYIDVPVDTDCYDSSCCDSFEGTEESQEEDSKDTDSKEIR